MAHVTTPILHVGLQKLGTRPMRKLQVFRASERPAVAGALRLELSIDNRFRRLAETKP